MVKDLLADETIALVEQWLTAASRTETPADRATTGPLQDLIEDPDGAAFTMRFVDRVARPDNAVAAHQLRTVVASGRLPAFLSPFDRILLRLGSAVATRLPGVVMPLARRRMRQLVGHLVVDADPDALAQHLQQRINSGFSQNVNLLGEAVLGEREADRRLHATAALLDQPQIDYVSIKVSAVASQLNYWDWEGSVERVVERLRVLFGRAMSTSPRTFVNLDMEEYHDLELTVAAFTRVLDEPRFASLDAGIVLQAYLPDAFPNLRSLVHWATARRTAGEGRSRFAWSRAPTWPWNVLMLPSMDGNKHRTPPSGRSMPTTSAASTGCSRPSGRPRSASGWPATICSTLHGPTCSELRET